MTPSSTPGTGSGTSSEAEQPHPPRRPVGGAAAWRTAPLAHPARPDEERRARERTRYGRKPIRESVADWIAEGRAHPIAMLGVALFLGGWIVLRALTPTAVAFEDIEAGQCLYVRTGGSSSIEGGDRPIGTPALVRASLLLGAAEPAPCDGGHGHEVAARVPLPDSDADRYPGEAALLSAAEDGCEAMFVAYVGRPLDGSPLTVTAVVPDEGRWNAGIRDALCLVHRRDGQFLQSSMQGSGE